MLDKKRYLSHKIETLMGMFPCVAVIGPRQCGKSTLVRAVYPEWKYYDLERPDDYQLITSDPLGFFSRQREKTIIDEAQQFPDLFKVLRGIIDQDRKACGRFLITGSSSPDIVSGLSESLAGRIATIELWPFKMGEFYEKPLPAIYERLIERSTCLADLMDMETSITINQVYDHWLFGGYPEPRIKGETNQLFHGLWMDEYFADYIRRDIQRLFPRLNTHNFRLFIQSLSYHSGKIINQSSIARALEVSSVTAKEYLEILHNTFVWRNLRSFEKNSLKKIQKMPKGFFRDQGILHHLLKVDEIDRLLIHPVAGTSFESFAIEEIIRGFQSTLKHAIDFNFYRTRDKAEIDLIVDGPFGFIPIEIKLGTQLTQRMLGPLKAFIKETGTRFGILVNNSEKIEIVAENIIQIPANYL
jgi:predicted AAA+ superfamily ATPase